LSASRRRTDDLIDRLILDIKALVLLQDSDAELRGRLQEKLAESGDDSVKRFVDALQSGKRPGIGRLLIMALGELIMASILVLAGAVVLLPVFAGINTPSGLVKYFTAGLYTDIGNSPLSNYLPLIGFVIGAILMVSAFYALHQAALNLKEAGVAVRPGEA
jgi:hypothetical protein